MPKDDLKARVTSLEHEVARLREETAATRALAALADRDVSEFRTELRGHHQVLRALRETQLEQGQKIEEQGRKLEELILFVCFAGCRSTLGCWLLSGRAGGSHRR